MASAACVNNITTAMSPDTTLPSYSWLSRLSDASDPRRPSDVQDLNELQDPVDVVDDFEFRLEDPVTIIPADELFSDGKLQVTTTFSASRTTDVVLEAKNEPRPSFRRIEMGVSNSTDSYLFSPKAPRCSSRWKEILGLKKYSQSQSATSNSNGSGNAGTRTSAFKHFLHRSSRSSSSSSSCSCISSLDQSLSMPLLKDKDLDIDCQSVSISASRLSLSSSASSSSSYQYGVSVNSEKPKPDSNSLQSPNPSPNPFVLNRNPNMKMVKPRAENGNGNGSSNTRVGRSPVRRPVGESSTNGVQSRGVSVDSPRMNSSGKIVFQSLERSSSSPSSFNGGPRFKHRGMERSYSANVRVTPVLNVPVCSLPKSVFGLGQLFSSSPQKREGSSKGQPNGSRNRADRT